MEHRPDVDDAVCLRVLQPNTDHKVPNEFPAIEEGLGEHAPRTQRDRSTPSQPVPGQRHVSELVSTADRLRSD
jgi:hypothetical protein